MRRNQKKKKEKITKENKQTNSEIECTQVRGGFLGLGAGEYVQKPHKKNWGAKIEPAGCRQKLYFSGLCGTPKKVPPSELYPSHSSFFLFQKKKKKMYFSHCFLLLLLLLFSPSILFAEEDSFSSSSSFSLVSKTTQNPRIVGGDIVTSPNPYPWIVSLSYGCSGSSSRFVCAGSVIDSNAVMTAAHCLDFSCSSISGRISVGLDKDDPDQRVNLKAYATHPSYVQGEFGFDNDIAVWFIDGEFNIDTFAQLPEDDIDSGTSVTAAGWGLDEDGDLPDRLREVDLEIQDNSVCRALYGPVYSEGTELCAGNAGREDTCQGDSGGPLFREGNIVYGVTSYGLVDCGSGPGSVYTRVYAYKDWVERVIEKYNDGDVIIQDSESLASFGVEMFVGCWVLVFGVLFWQF